MSPSQRTGGGYSKWVLWDRMDGRIVCGHLTRKEAAQDATERNAGGTERYVSAKRAEAEHWQQLGLRSRS